MTKPGSFRRLIRNLARAHQAEAARQAEPEQLCPECRALIRRLRAQAAAVIQNDTESADEPPKP